MLSYLLDNLTGTKSQQPSYPSAVLLVGDLSRQVDFLHIVREDGTQERLAFPGSKAIKLSYGGSTERSREQLDPILLHVGDGESKGRFLDDVGRRATELLTKTEKFTLDGDGSTAPPVYSTLRSAVVECSEKRKDRPPPQGATQTYPVYIVQIERSRPGKLIKDTAFTSFPS